MAKGRLTLRQIKEVLRLYWHLKHNKSFVARATKIPRTTVCEYIVRTSALGLKWPLPSDLTEEELEQKIYPKKRTARKSPDPDWDKVHKELKRKGVTRELLWQEYIRENPDGCHYSWFADKYKHWAKTKNVWMHQEHKAGEEVYVDFSGLTVPIWDSSLQKILYSAEIFVAVLGASDLIYCKACPDQTLPSWIDVHCHMFEFYGGASEIIIPDNLRSAVTKAHRYEPSTNRTYEDLAIHYGCAVMPARSYRPKDKAKAEKSVQTVQRKILAPVRDKQFTSIEHLNSHISEKIIEINEKPMQKLSYSRQTLFDEIEKSVLKPLPTTKFVLSEWSVATLNGSYHVCINRHFYSVPYKHVSKKIDIRVTSVTIECFYREQRIACHKINNTEGGYTTLPEHMPESHRQQLLWNASKLKQWANNIGENTSILINKILTTNRRNIRQCEKSALGILRLSNAYDEIKLDAACKKALEIGTTRYDSVSSILKNGLENKDVSKLDQDVHLIQHDNLRGQKYYH